KNEWHIELWRGYLWGKDALIIHLCLQVLYISVILYCRNRAAPVAHPFIFNYNPSSILTLFPSVIEATLILFKGSLSKARAKLKYEAFVELNDHLVHSFYDHFESETWFGFNLMAIDGTTLRVPAISQIANHFGVWNSTKGEKPCPQSPRVPNV
ncbi:MAG: hypothetical protein KJP07_00250, partial [Desulfatitalea sp.]|nr:hypothetical protein [Desulfatitalea sp.]